jgi:hypothetical protein
LVWILLELTAGLNKDNEECPGVEDDEDDGSNVEDIDDE